jgi:hypothetical protein
MRSGASVCQLLAVSVVPRAARTGRGPDGVDVDVDVEVDVEVDAFISIPSVWE